MDTGWSRLCILLVLCAEFYLQVGAATISASVTPDSPIVGPNQQTITCNFNLQTGDYFQTAKLKYSNGNEILSMISNGNVIWVNDPPPTEFQRRGYLEGSKDAGYLSLILNDTTCGDNGQAYECLLEYSNDGLEKRTDTITAQVRAPPQAPNEIVRTPETENVTEYSSMTFECRGNVGRPAGSLQWYTFIGDPSNSGAGLDVTAQANQEQETPASDGCTFERVSRLTLNLSRTEADERLVVRCRVDHSLGNPDTSACSDPSADFCRKSLPINVQYPVSASVDSDTRTAEEGTDTSFVCSTRGNPTPRVEWQREGHNETTMGNRLTLRNLTLGDTGLYICTAFNTIAGVTRNASATVLLTVAEVTTPQPTTTPTSTPSTTPDKDDEPKKAGSGDDTTIIIVVVVVVLVVIIVAIIAVIVFLKRRKKGKEVEEPPEKPFNNHAGINTVATRPDLVSNSYNSSPSPVKNEDGLAYAELQFDNKPRSRRPVALNESCTDYSDVSMPQV